ncbi:MAG: hypothetical protein ACQ9MH_01755 [Nitrospinales bacterium]
MYDWPHIDGINIKKPAFRTHLRLSKLYAVRKFKPSSIILGTSRAELGIDPDHPKWSSKPVYNLSLNSVNIYEAFRYMQHANASRPLKQVVLMLDLFMFNVDTNPNTQDFEEHRLAVDAEGHPQNSYFDNISILGSLDTFRNSISTLLKHDSDDFESYLPNGVRKPGFQRLLVERSGGHHEIFTYMEKFYIKYYYKSFKFTNSEWDNWKVYRNLIDMAHKNKIDLRLVIAPTHARLLETMSLMNVWQTFEQWKQKLVLINEEEATQFGKTPFPLWDFSGYNKYSIEEVPPLGDTKTVMRWHWESSHYKPALGDLLLDRIFDSEDPESGASLDFGIQLTSGNIENHLEKIRKDRQQWRVDFPLEVKEIQSFRN